MMNTNQERKEIQGRINMALDEEKLEQVTGGENPHWDDPEEPVLNPALNEEQQNLHTEPNTKPATGGIRKKYRRRYW